MPSATLQFDLNDEGDREDFKLLSHARSMYSFIWDYSMALRDMHKHGVEEHIVTAEDMLKEVREKFFELIEAHDLFPLEIS